MPNSFERAFNPAFQGGTALASRLFEQDRAEKLRLSEQLRVEKLFDARLADQRKYTVMQRLISEAGRVGIPANEIADMEEYGDPGAFASVLEERARDFDAGSSPEPTAPTKEQSESSSFLYGQRLRDQKQAVEDFKAETALGVAVNTENRLQKHRDDSAKKVRDYAVLVGLRERGAIAGIPQSVLNDFESFGDLKAFSAFVRRAEEQFRKGSSFSPTVPTEAEGSSESFSLGRELRDELLFKQNKADESKRNELIIQDELLQRSRHISALRGQVGSIEGLPQYWISRLFSKDGVVSGEAFDHISQNLVQRTLNKEGIPTTVWTYMNLPKPKSPVDSAAGERTEPPPVNSAAGKSLPPSSAKPVVDEVAELDFWRKLPVYGYSKEDDMLLKSDDPNVWRPALRRIKSNTTLRPGTYVGAKPTYHWTPGKSSFQSVPTNSLPMMPASIEPDDSDPR